MFKAGVIICLALMMSGCTVKCVTPMVMPDISRQEREKHLIELQIQYFENELSPGNRLTELQTQKLLFELNNTSNKLKTDK